MICACCSSARSGSKAAIQQASRPTDCNSYAAVWGVGASGAGTVVLVDERPAVSPVQIETQTMQTPLWSLMRGARGRSRHISIKSLSSGIRAHMLDDHIWATRSPDFSLGLNVTSHDQLLLRVTVNREGYRRHEPPKPLSHAGVKKSALWRTSYDDRYIECSLLSFAS